MINIEDIQGAAEPRWGGWVWVVGRNEQRWSSDRLKLSASESFAKSLSDSARKMHSIFMSARKSTNTTDGTARCNREPETTRRIGDDH
jgi:hypothetical protein